MCVYVFAIEIGFSQDGKPFLVSFPLTIRLVDRLRECVRKCCVVFACYVGRATITTDGFWGFPSGVI